MFIIEQLSSGMTSTYNNLKEEKDWLKLFDRLVMKSGWCQPSEIGFSSRLLKDVFKGELQNAVGLLLHALTPVRFVFLEGQSRMTSLYNYQRKIIPTRELHPIPLSKATIFLDKQWSLQQHWSLVKTGDMAVCHFPDDVEADAVYVTFDYLAQLREISHKYMSFLSDTIHTVKTVKLNNLADCIDQLIQHYHVTNVVYKASSLQGSLINAFKCVLTYVRSSEVELQTHLLGKKFQRKLDEKDETHFLEELFHCIYKLTSNGKTFPSLRTGEKIPPMLHELMVIMLVLGCALVDSTSRQYLACCMNKEWIVPILHEVQVENHPIENLHEETYVNGSIESALFFSKYYSVSDWLYVCYIIIICMDWY